MNAYKLVYLPTGRTIYGNDGLPVVVDANTERGAKQKFTKARFYVSWDLHVVVLLNKAEQQGRELLG